MQLEKYKVALSILYVYRRICIRELEDIKVLFSKEDF